MKPINYEKSHISSQNDNGQLLKKQLPLLFLSPIKIIWAVVQKIITTQKPVIPLNILNIFDKLLFDQ